MSKYDKHSRHRSSKNSGRGPKHPPKAEQNVDETSPVIQMFRQYQNELDSRYDKHERIVKLSRDITIESKRTIGELHRLAGHDSPELVIQRAEEKLAWIRSHLWRPLAAELDGEDPYRFLRAYSPGLQEYIEAVSFLHYLTQHGLVSLTTIEEQLVFPPEPETPASSKSEADCDTHIEKDSEKQTTVEEVTRTAESSTPSDGNIKTDEQKCLHVVHVPPVEYLLGIADLTGELMRMTISSVGKGDLDTPFKVVAFMRAIYDSFVSFKKVSRDLSHKMRVLRQSLQKVETACYNLQVRSSEIPREMLVEMLSAGNDEMDGGGMDDM